MPKRILLIDDDAPILILMKNLLPEILGIDVEVVTTTTVQHALDTLRSLGPFDLVITDYLLKDGTGGDVLRAVRTGIVAGPQGTSEVTPVGCLTSDIPSETFTFHRYKPFDVLEFAAVVRASLLP